ncbi:MAG: hypothetical protein H7A25_12915 [Leptospiraceae bacterium]|nr:hypothetical protein [Leptospiraceae bacterium]MCP5500801.1 hypothetical protein [Leptospiraceae bacterium]
MERENIETDEDKMIKHYKDHKNIVTWFLEKLKKAKIKAERTVGNDPKGDILYYNEKDTEKVQKLARELKDKYK